MRGLGDLPASRASQESVVTTGARTSLGARNRGVMLQPKLTHNVYDEGRLELGLKPPHSSIRSHCRGW
jgi:hypothetical protein